jgi:hypothetical protein
MSFLEPQWQALLKAVFVYITCEVDPASIPYVNASSGAAWFPHCVSGRLKYAIGENPHVSPNHGR